MGNLNLKWSEFLSTFYRISYIGEQFIQQARIGEIKKHKLSSAFLNDTK